MTTLQPTMSISIDRWLEGVDYLKQRQWMLCQTICTTYNDDMSTRNKFFVMRQGDTFYCITATYSKDEHGRLIVSGGSVINAENFVLDALDLVE